MWARTNGVGSPERSALSCWNCRTPTTPASPAAAIASPAQSGRRAPRQQPRRGKRQRQREERREEPSVVRVVVGRPHERGEDQERAQRPRTTRAPAAAAACAATPPAQQTADEAAANTSAAAAIARVGRRLGHAQAGEALQPRPHRQPGPRPAARSALRRHLATTSPARARRTGARPLRTPPPLPRGTGRSRARRARPPDDERQGEHRQHRPQLDRHGEAEHDARPHQPPRARRVSASPSNATTAPSRQSSTSQGSSSTVCAAVMPEGYTARSPQASVTASAPRRRTSHPASGTAAAPAHAVSTRATANALAVPVALASRPSGASKQHDPRAAGRGRSPCTGATPLASLTALPKYTPSSYSVTPSR